MKKLSLAALLLNLCLACLPTSLAALATQPVRAQAAPPPVVGSIVTEERAEELRLKTFDLVWRTVRDKHFDPTLGGVDWDRVRRQYEPRAVGAANNAELYLVLQEMLGELHQSHFNIIPPEAITPDDQHEVGGGVGIDLRLLDDAAVITRLDEDSPATRAGLRPGFIIRRVGAQRVEQLWESARSPFTEASKTSADSSAAQTAALIATLRKTRKVLAALAGEPSSTVTVEYLDAANAPHEVTLTRARLRGELSPRLGAFPPQYTEFATRRLASADHLDNGKLDSDKHGLDNDKRGPGVANRARYIGYIRFNVFTMPIVTKLREAMVNFRDAEGIIFDLRGNPGGVGGIATSLAGQLINRPGSLGTMKMRASEVRFAINAQGDSYAGPVAILLDGMSASTSELLAAGLQEMGRAVIVGERSLGACLPSYLQKLPTGALLQFAIADFRTPKGVLIEGRGVAPNLPVALSRASLLAGHDAPLEAALARLAELPRKDQLIK